MRLDPNKTWTFQIDEDDGRSLTVRTGSLGFWMEFDADTKALNDGLEASGDAFEFARGAVDLLKRAVIGWSGFIHGTTGEPIESGDWSEFASGIDFADLMKIILLLPHRATISDDDRKKSKSPQPSEPANSAATVTPAAADA